VPAIGDGDRRTRAGQLEHAVHATASGCAADPPAHRRRVGAPAKQASTVDDGAEGRRARGAPRAPDPAPSAASTRTDIFRNQDRSRKLEVRTFRRRWGAQLAAVVAPPALERDHRTPRAQV
jgi:hypothetical protein